MLDYLIAITFIGGIVLASLATVLFVVGGVVDICNGEARYIYSSGPALLSALCLLVVSAGLHYFFPFTNYP